MTWVLCFYGKLQIGCYYTFGVNFGIMCHNSSTLSFFLKTYKFFFMVILRWEA